MGRLAHTGWAGVKRVRVDATDCPVARERLRKLKEVERLIAAGCKRLTAISSQGVGKSAYYEWRGRFGREGLRGLSPKSRRPRSHPGRQWTMQDAERIRRLRERHPWAGAAKLHVLHNREHPRLALAAVKRIVSWLLKRRRILRCDFAERGGSRRQRDFSGSHARRWDMRRDWHAAIQVDHMTLSGDGVTLKGFHAVAPGDRRFCGRMYSRASSGCAADFLRAARRRVGRRCRPPHPGGRRLRVHGRVRAGLHATGHRAAGAAGPQAAVERPGREDQPHRQDGVLEPLSGRVELPGHERAHGRVHPLLQQRAAPSLAGNENPRRSGYNGGGVCMN